MRYKNWGLDRNLLSAFSNNQAATITNNKLNPKQEAEPVVKNNNLFNWIIIYISN